MSGPRSLLPATRSAAGTAALLAAVLLAATGCQGDDTARTAGPAHHRHHAHQAHQAHDHSQHHHRHSQHRQQDAASEATASPTEPTSPPAGSGTPAGLRAALLDPADLPALAGQGWRQAGPDGPQRDPVGTCPRFDLPTIGAMKAQARRFSGTAGDGLAATQVVARFPDIRTAQRAAGTLAGWHRDCPDRMVTYARSDVGPAHDLPVSRGRGQWYLVSFGPPPGASSAAATVHEAFGMVRYHRLVAAISLHQVVRTDASGSDADGADAVQRAVARMAEALH